MAVSGAKERIDAALKGWSGITSQPHRFGGTEYCLGRREIGHVHGDSLVDIPFPKTVRNELVADGRAEPHPNVRPGFQLVLPVYRNTKLFPRFVISIRTISELLDTPRREVV